MSLATQPGHSEVTRSASPDNMNALEASETSDSGPTVAETEKKGNDLAGGRKESKVVSLVDDREGREGEENDDGKRLDDFGISRVREGVGRLRVRELMFAWRRGGGGTEGCLRSEKSEG